MEKTLINRQVESTNTYTTPTETQKQQQDIADSFHSYFAETALHKIDTAITDNNIQVNIYASTPLTKDAYAIQIESWEQLLFDLFDKEISVTNYISYLQES